VAEFRRGAEAIAEAAKSKKGSGKFFPNIRWEAEETKYIQFLMPMDEVPTVLMHQWIIIGHREDGTPMLEKFISRRDPSLEGPDGYDELIERFGQTPTERTIILALEVEPKFAAAASGSRRKTIEGFKPVEKQFERDDETVTVPAFGLIIESPQTFSNALAANNDLAPIEETVYAVKRLGAGRDTNYTFINTGHETLDVEDELADFEERFDFEEYLDELASEDRMRELIEPLADDWRIAKYDKRKKGKGQKDDDGDGKGDKPARRRRTARPAASAEPEAEAEESEAEEAPAEEKKEKPGPSRSRRFAELRSSVKTRE
jgi:hypothetical protein